MDSIPKYLYFGVSNRKQLEECFRYGIFEKKVTLTARRETLFYYIGVQVDTSDLDVKRLSDDLFCADSIPEKNIITGYDKPFIQGWENRKLPKYIEMPKYVYHGNLNIICCACCALDKISTIPLYRKFVPMVCQLPGFSVHPVPNFSVFSNSCFTISYECVILFHHAGKLQCMYLS